jgi:hypothetical protein
MPAERTRCKSFLTKPRPGMRCSDRQRKVKVTQSVRSLGRNGGGGWISGPPRRHPEVPERSDGLEGCCSAVRLLCCASFEARPTSSGERLRMTSQNKRCPHDTVTLISVRDLPKFHPGGSAVRPVRNSQVIAPCEFGGGVLRPASIRIPDRIHEGGYL